MPGQRTTTPTRNRKTTPQAKERTTGNPTQQNPIPIRRSATPIVNTTVQQLPTAPMPQYQYPMQPMYQTYGHGPINHTPHNMIHPMQYNPPYAYPGPQYHDITHTMRPLPPYGNPPPLTSVTANRDIANPKTSPNPGSTTPRQQKKGTVRIKNA